MNHEFFRTPESALVSLDKNVPLARSAILDPCCGDGAIVDYFRGSRGFDLIDRAEGRFLTRDALSEVPWNTECVVMNPPFKQSLKFVQRALNEVGSEGTVCALLQLSFMASSGRHQFHVDNPSDAFVLSKRPSFMDHGGASFECAWFVWSPTSSGKWKSV